MKTQQKPQKKWNILKAVLGGIFIVLSTCIKNNQKEHENDLLMQLKTVKE